MSEVRVEVRKMPSRYYEIIMTKYGRLLLIRQPDAWVIDSSDGERLPLLELERDIERRLERR